MHSLATEFVKQMLSTRDIAIKELRQIPGVGRTIANDLWNIGFKSIADLKGHDPQMIYTLHNRFKGATQDRCMLYVGFVNTFMKRAQ